MRDNIFIRGRCAGKLSILVGTFRSMITCSGTDWVANAGLGPIGRNAGEVIGVFATLDWSEKPGISLSSFISGQVIKATHISFSSSIKTHSLRLIEERLKSLQSPQVAGGYLRIHRQGAKRTWRAPVRYLCESCHTRIQRDDPRRRIVAHMSRLKDIGTDMGMAWNAAMHTGFSGILRNEYVNAGPGSVLIDERAPVAALLT